MTGWSDLVTTALLGTDRRPVPHDLPSGWAGAGAGASHSPANATLQVLELAAQHRAAAQAGAPSGGLAAPPTAPPARLALAPPEAQELLGELLRRPEPTVVNAWLAECGRRGLGASPDLWHRLAQLAARNGSYDRAVLLEVLGPRGRWFLQQFPEGVRLLAATRTGSAEPPSRAAAEVDTARAQAGGTADRPLAMLLAVPDPWSAELARAAVGALTGGGLGAQARSAAVLIGSRLPLELAGGLLAEAAAELHDAPPHTVQALRLAEGSLALAERTVRSRVEIMTAFSSAEPHREPPS